MRIMKEQGKQGWMIVAVLFATMFLIWGPVNASSVFFLPVVRHFGWSRAFFSLLVATVPLAAGFSSPGIGSTRRAWRRGWVAGFSLRAMRSGYGVCWPNRFLTG